MPLTFRPLAAADASLARALAKRALGDAPFAEPLLTALDNALDRRTDEYQMIVACDGDRLAGVVVFGEIAGTLRTGRIQCIAVEGNARRQGIALALINGACERLRERSGRLVLIELPMDPRLSAAHRLALRAGFHEEGRMDDYVRDGVALVLLRRDLRTPPIWDAPPAAL